MNELAQAAVEYLHADMHLLALTGKRPNSRYHETWDWDNSIHGMPLTLADTEALKEVFTHPTTTGIAILIPEHVLVADVDTEAAATLFTELAGDIETWETRTSRTPNGLHLWYLAPGANSTVWVGDRTLLFKGFGGYVAAPPSRHFDENGVEDGVYTWLGDWQPVDWLPEGIRERIKFERALAGDPIEQKKHPIWSVPLDANGHWTWKGWSYYSIEGLCKAIREAPDGNQNNMIAWAAMQARDEGVPFESAMPQLLAAAIEGGHPEHRARTTIRGAYKRAARG